MHAHTHSDIYRKKKLLDNFGQILENLFKPIFEVTLDPSSHPNLHKFLNQVHLLTTGNPSVLYCQWHPKITKQEVQKYIHGECMGYTYLTLKGART